MPWTFTPAFDAGHRAALQAGKNLVYVSPPAGWAVRPLFAQLTSADSDGVRTLVLAPEPSSARLVARFASTLEALAPAAAVGGVARAARLLTSGRLRTLVADPPAILQLAERARLDLGGVSRVVVLWPELHAALGGEQGLDTILAEARGAQRLIATADPHDATAFLQRHAHRAPVLSAAPLPDGPTGSVRFAVVEEDRVEAAVHAVLDGMDPATALVWDPTDRAERIAAQLAHDGSVCVTSGAVEGTAALAVVTELPSRDVLAALGAAATDVVVLIRAWQRAYLDRLVARSTPFRLPSAADGAADQRRRWREELRARLDSETPTASLLALAPLFDEFDPALVAAALLAERAAPSGPGAGTASGMATWVHLRLGVGSKDRVRTSDLVGALLNAVGVAKHQIGRVDVRETYSVMEVRAEAAEAARRGLDGMTIKGRSVTARFDQR